MTMTAEVDLTEARAQLIVAEAAVEQQRREDAQAQVRRIVGRIAELRPMVDSQNNEAIIGQNMRLEAHYKLQNCWEQIRKWTALLTDPLSAPTERELAFRRLQLRRWQQREQRLLKQYAEGNRREALLRPAMEGNAELKQLKYSLANYAQIAYPPDDKGLRHVPADFLHIGSDPRVLRVSDQLLIIPEDEAPDASLPTWERL
jgi:hypothetical protein